MKATGQSTSTRSRKVPAGVYLHYGQADQRKLTDVKPGRYFGEMGLIAQEKRSATAVIGEDA